MVISATVDQLINETVENMDSTLLRQRYLDQDEFLVIDQFLPPHLLKEWGQELELLKPHVHRNFIPKHKKGGSVGFDTLKQFAPNIHQVYQSPALLRFLNQIVGTQIHECPPSDPHRCVLYSYTEEGDHIGFHYDTSYYKDRRWTLLLGFQDNSSSHLVCRLHTKNPSHPVEELQLKITPGMLVLFNGDKVHHCVTPIKANEFRFIISMQFVTSGEMSFFMRFVSNMKDAIAYFGIKQVFFGRKSKSPDQTSP